MATSHGGTLVSGPVYRLRRAARLSWRTRRELARSLWLLPVIAWRLRRDGYATTLAWVDRQGVCGADGQRQITSTAGDSPGWAASPADVAWAREVAFAVRQVARLVPDATCLRRTLVHRRLLARKGVPSTVVTGVRRDVDDELAFHAWLEVASEVVSEPPVSVAAYVRLLGGPPPGTG